MAKGKNVLTTGDVAKICNRRKIAYSPGCGSATEISRADDVFCGSSVPGLPPRLTRRYDGPLLPQPMPLSSDNVEINTAIIIDTMILGVFSINFLLLQCFRYRVIQWNDVLRLLI